ncbi:MAG TPA: hypothetical protein VII98_01795 [Solirubrobacteraceae bacterium]
MRRVLVLSTAAILVLLVTSPAEAASSPFKLGTYKGKTSQGNPVLFSIVKATCNTGQVVGGVEQTKAGTCLSIQNETPHIVGTCSNGVPVQYGSVGGTYLIPKSGTVKLKGLIGTYDLRVTFRIGHNGRATGTGHFHEEYRYAPSPTAAPVNVVCESGAVTFKAKRTGR